MANAASIFEVGKDHHDYNDVHSNLVQTTTMATMTSLIEVSKDDKEYNNIHDNYGR